jgi:uncharacterized Ntn-hydrolase superfamily protein
MVRLTSLLMLASALTAWHSGAFAVDESRLSAPAASPLPPHIATFSIVAYDPDSGDYGVAVQSKYFSVGSVVPFARAGTGALATQARGNPQHGPAGLDLMGAGMTAAEALKQLIDKDPLGDGRQVGLVDAEGRAATYTGSQCLPWAGGKTGEHYAVQGNLLAGPQVVDAMAATFEATTGDLATRLVSAIAAGQAAGGDARGRQSAAVLVVRKEAGYLGLTDRLVDLHVEDHATPILELERLLSIRLAQLDAETATALLEEAAETSDDKRDALVEKARAAAERGLDTYDGDDHLWWLLAQARLLGGDSAGAVEAARRALLIRPSWPRLPEATRTELGLDTAVLDELLRDEGFHRLWESLAAGEDAA